MNDIHRLMRDWVCLLAVLGMVGVTACSKGDRVSSSRAQQDTATASSPTGEMVDVWLEDEYSKKQLHFRIPRNYLSRNYMANSGGKQPAMFIETGLPELQPRPSVFWIAEEAKKVGLASAIEKNRNGLLIEVDRFIPIATYDARVRARFLATYHRDASLDIAGLEGYSGNTCKEVAQGDSRKIQCAATNEDEIYFPQRRDENEGTRLVFMSCIRPSQNDGGGCTADELYRYRGMKFIFRRSELERWREFETASYELLNRFIVNDQ